MAHALNTFYCRGAVGTILNPNTIGCVWTGKIDLNTLLVDGEIFESWKKKLRIKKYPNTCERGLSWIGCQEHRDKHVYMHVKSNQSRRLNMLMLLLTGTNTLMMWKKWMVAINSFHGCQSSDREDSVQHLKLEPSKCSLHHSHQFDHLSRTIPCLRRAQPLLSPFCTEKEYVP